MNGVLNLGLLLIMICYAVLNGTGGYFLKISLNKITKVEMTLGGFFRNPIRGIYELLKVPTWFIGGVLFVSGFLIYQYALSLYDLSVVKPLSNLNLIILFLLGFKLLKEEITKREIIGIVTIVSGVILTSMYASEKGADLNLGNMISFSIILIIIPLFFIFITILKQSKKIDEYYLTIVSGILFSLGAIYNNAIYVYGKSIYGDNLSLEFFFLNPFLYLLVISYFFAFFIGQVALARGRMVIVGPVLSLLTVGLPILGAIFIFNEDLIIAFDNNIIFPLSFFKLIGIFLILIGILIIYPKSNPLQKTE